MAGVMAGVRHVFSIPLRTRFRGITVREGVLIRGEHGKRTLFVLPAALFVVSSELGVPANRDAPIAARVAMRDTAMVAASIAGCDSMPVRSSPSPRRGMAFISSTTRI